MVLYSPTGSTANTMKLVIRSTPTVSYGGWYTYSMPDFTQAILGLFGFGTVTNNQGIFDPLVLDVTIWPVNNSQGFEVRAYGPTVSQAYNKLFQLQVATGKMEDQSWAFKLYYNGTLAMDGTALHCLSQFCGLNSSYFNAGY